MHWHISCLRVLVAGQLSLEGKFVLPLSSFVDLVGLVVTCAEKFNLEDVISLILESETAHSEVSDG
jgi:hypothetical protein